MESQQQQQKKPSTGKKSSGGKKSSKAAAAPKISIVDEVQTRYEAAGWQTMRGGNAVDIIARRDKRYQFIQVIPAESASDPAWTGEARNSFVQNALSNNAEPIHALVATSKARDGSTKVKVSLSNTNLGSAVKLVAPRAAKSASAADVPK